MNKHLEIQVLLLKNIRTLERRLNKNEDITETGLEGF